jgi:hypothetical protein
VAQNAHLNLFLESEPQKWGSSMNREEMRKMNMDLRGSTTLPTSTMRNPLLGFL